VGHVAVPDFVRVFRQLDARDLLLAVLVEQADLDFGRVRREEREVHAFAVPRRATRVGRPLSDAMSCGPWHSNVIHATTVPRMNHRGEKAVSQSFAARGWRETRLVQLGSPRADLNAPNDCFRANALRKSLAAGSAAAATS